ncbi:MAG TPA: ferredoxin [archaeon]|nr:ferredoxin [archaeon]
MKYKVTYDRDGCISAAACVGVNAKYWELDAADGRANLKGSEKNPETNLFEMEIDEADLPEMKAAAEVCPVLIIHIYDEKGEKVF